MVDMVDNSRLVAVAKCDTDAVVQHVLGYQGRDEPAPRKFGKDAHVSLATYFEKEGIITYAMDALEREYRAFAEENVPPGDRLCWENVCAIMQEYYQAHPIERFPFVPDPDSVEKGIVAKLTDEIEFWGLVDLVGAEKTTGGLYVVDHKTTGRLTGWWGKQFRIGSQLSGYIWALMQTRDTPVVGAFINAIEIAKLPYERPKAKCRIHKVSYEECWRSHARWDLLVTSRTPDMIAKWKEDAVGLAKRFVGLNKIFGGRPELVQYASQQGVFNNSCTFCQFRDFCAAERKPELIESMLTYAPWRPWDDTQT